MPEDGDSVGPLDTELLGRVESRLSGVTASRGVQFRPETAPNAVVAEYDMGHFPESIDRVSLRIRWFETDEFNVHYDHGESWECRWDRYPNAHNTRDDIHPPPDPQTPGDDAAYPDDWREGLAQVLTDLDERIESFWDYE